MSALGKPLGPLLVHHFVQFVADRYELSIMGSSAIKCGERDKYTYDCSSALRLSSSTSESSVTYARSKSPNRFIISMTFFLLPVYCCLMISMINHDLNGLTHLADFEDVLDTTKGRFEGWQGVRGCSADFDDILEPMPSCIEIVAPRTALAR